MMGMNIFFALSVDLSAYFTILLISVIAFAFIVMHVSINIQKLISDIPIGHSMIYKAKETI